jgi:hypothetical protein
LYTFFISCPYKTSGDERSGDEGSGDERSGILNVRQRKVRHQNIRQGYFVTKRPKYIISSLLYCLAMVPVDQVTEFYNTVVQDYLEAHAQDEGFQDDISSFLTYY